MNRKRVAIQGVAGAYHEVAARAFFNDEEIEIVPCLTFKDLFAALQNDPDLYAACAIENTIAGSLLPNYDMLRQSDVVIIGEHKLRISHTLCALPGTRLEDVVEVNSHPIALMQCGDFLDTIPYVKVVEKEDTALSAKVIKEKNLVGYAAICSKHAALSYGLEILAEGIETNKRNFTRFLMLANKKNLQKDQVVDKASLVFTLPHKEGSLSQVLSILSYYGISLTKIQSLPIIGREWEYQFYIDLSYTDFVRYRQSLDAVKPLMGELKVLGEYRGGESPEVG